MSAAPQEVVQITRGRSLAAQIEDKCIHFNGLQNDRCDAGVRYEVVRVEHAPIAYRRADSPAVYRQSASRPCHDSMNLGGAVCTNRCAPTPEYVAKRVADSEREIAATFTARARITDATGGKRGATGVVECPVCNGKLSYSVASSNGHIHARCATQGCVAWME